MYMYTPTPNTYTFRQTDRHFTEKENIPLCITFKINDALDF